MRTIKKRFKSTREFTNRIMILQSPLFKGTVFGNPNQPLGEIVIVCSFLPGERIKCQLKQQDNRNVISFAVPTGIKSVEYS